MRCAVANDAHDVETRREITDVLGIFIDNGDIIALLAKLLGQRLTDSIETAAALSGGVVAVDVIGDTELYFSQNYACEEHGISFPELEPRMFSFNNPIGACPECSGIGNMQSISVKKLIPHPEMTLREGGISVNGFRTMTEDSWTGPLVIEVGKDFGFDIEASFKEAHRIPAKITGHCHADLSYKDESGFLYITTMLAGRKNSGWKPNADGTFFEREPFSDKETSVDLFTFDPESYTLSAVRYGSGIDRKFDI